MKIPSGTDLLCELESFHLVDAVEDHLEQRLHLFHVTGAALTLLGHYKHNQWNMDRNTHTGI